MTMTKKNFIGFGLLVLLVGGAGLLSSCMTPTVSRVPVPGSAMTAVVTADLAGCYDVKLYEHGHPLAGQLQCLGPYGSSHCSLTQVTTTSNIVTIAWTDGSYHYSTSVDIDARQFVVYSNGVPVR
jgi:hypothetical protein